jgi:hypothetical protein
MSERNAGAIVNTCKAVFNHHFILSINKIKNKKNYTMIIFHKLRVQIFMDVTHPVPLDAEGTGSSFHQNV